MNSLMESVKLFYIAFMLISVLACYVLNSCTESNLCNKESSSISIKVIPDSLFCKLQNTDSIKSTEGVHIIIESQNDLKKYVFCTSGLPTLDFNSYFLIAGKVFWPN